MFGQQWLLPFAQWGMLSSRTGSAGGSAAALVGLARGCFDHVQWRRGWDDPFELVAGLLQERAVLGLCALASAHHEHEKVKDLPWAWRVAGRESFFDDEQPAALDGRVAAAAQNRDAVLVVPVMEDVLEDVGVPVGTDSKKSPPTTVARSATPGAAANSSAAPSTMTGRSNSTPRNEGVARRMDASSKPWLPPTSTSV
jgi:hypothetical protein